MTDEVDSEAIRAFEHSRWQRAAPVYAASFATATRLFGDALLDAAGVRVGTRMLDLACGPGIVTAIAATRGAIPRGLDFSSAMLAVARASHQGVEFVEGDAEAPPFPDGAFDAVVSNFGIHHVPRPALALTAAHRVLRAGGRVAFSFWAEPTKNVAWKLLFDAVRRCGDPRAASAAPPPGGGFATAQDCLDALSAAGFADVRAQLEQRIWRHADGAGLVAALRAGTARMAAMIEAQPPDLLPAIIADIEANAAAFRDANGLALPVAAVIASGAKG